MRHRGVLRSGHVDLGVGDAFEQVRRRSASSHWLAHFERSRMSLSVSLAARRSHGSAGS